jgi:hypothetical protein
MTPGGAAKPGRGHPRNPVVVARIDLAFDDHGYSSLSRLLEHTVM